MVLYSRPVKVIVEGFRQEFVSTIFFLYLYHKNSLIYSAYRYIIKFHFLVLNAKKYIKAIIILLFTNSHICKGVYSIITFKIR